MAKIIEDELCYTWTCGPWLVENSVGKPGLSTMIKNAFKLKNNGSVKVPVKVIIKKGFISIERRTDNG